MGRGKIRFLADENIAPKVVLALRSRGYDVSDVKELRLSNQTPGPVAERLLAVLQPRILKRLKRSVVLVTDETVLLVH